MNLRKSRRTTTLFGVLLLALVPTLHAVPPDPCNFDDGSEAFSWDQVMTCYNSVPFNPDDLENAVEFMSAARERSDLAENLDARHDWRNSLTALGSQSFSSDFEMQMAIVSNHKEFHNGHWRYRRPWCYTAYLAAFMPFDFGSAILSTKKGTPKQQILFIEATPFLPDLYEEFTGVDPRQYIGMRVISINGVEPLQYFRDYGRNVYRVDTNDGEMLNEVLQNAAYSIRISHTHDVPPDQAGDTYVLENKQGRRVTVIMPWVFAPRTAFGSWQDPLPESSTQFEEACLAISSVEWLVRGASAGADAPAVASASLRNAGTDDFVTDIRDKREMAQNLRKEYGGNNSKGYFEVSPGNRWQTLEPVVPLSDGAVAYAISDRATILRLADFVQDWKAEVIAATNYACANTDRFIIDMRNNGGGYITQIEWLTTHFFPERTVPDEYSNTGRFLDGNPGREELTGRMTEFSDYVYGPGNCWWGYEAACHVDPTTGQVLTDWLSGTKSEVRGGVSVPLKRRSAFRNESVDYQAGTDTIACPGKFEGRTLIVLSNGTGASAGYFFPEGIRDQATIVTAGGRVGEPVVSGIARGGAVWGMNNFEAWSEQYFILYLSGLFGWGPPTDPLPYLVRDADSFIEQPGSYKADLTTLHMEGTSYGDIHIDVWGDSPDTDGFVYRKVLSAVQSMN